MNKKTVIKLVILAIALIVVGAIGTALTGGNQGGWGRRELMQVTMGNHDVDYVTIDLTDFRVEIRQSADNQFGLFTTAESLNMPVENGLMRISAPHNRRNFQLINIGFNDNSDHLVLYMPNREFREVDISTRNGLIRIDDVTTQKLVVNTQNGRVDVTNIVANETVVQTTNGVIEATNISSNLETASTNSRIILNDIEGNIYARTTNGVIDLYNETISQDVEIRTTNGAINVNLSRMPDDAEIRATTTVGRVTLFGNNENFATFGSGSNNVTLRTTNGRITVQ